MLYFIIQLFEREIREEREGHLATSHAHLDILAQQGTPALEPESSKSSPKRLKWTGIEVQSAG